MVPLQIESLGGFCHRMITEKGSGHTPKHLSTTSPFFLGLSAFQLHFLSQAPLREALCRGIAQVAQCLWYTLVPRANALKIAL